ncbi:hypothetical protein [Helicobacter sp. 10-6591]|uniref:hypothetical protein n=1 Tax=Helicobacter sp. 10-6591 TaxID=2004998 RepID=UPI000DCE42B6|nr:hypothetical protein [Helicobacter sp. 10-6591]RAX55481.1 hypothetical protein CCY97_04235 [Helicobacter sp. 10-6591]
MKSCRYWNLLQDLEQCSELIHGDINEIIKFSQREKDALVKILHIFQQTLENVGDVENFIDSLSDDDPVLF